MRWRIWDRHNRKWYKSVWGVTAWATKAEATKFFSNLTRGKRDPLTNWLRVRLAVVKVLKDGTSPQRDTIQKLWDEK